MSRDDLSDPAVRDVYEVKGMTEKGPMPNRHVEEAVERIEINNGCPLTTKACGNGEWVKFTDHEAALDRLREEVQEYRVRVVQAENALLPAGRQQIEAALTTERERREVAESERNQALIELRVVTTNSQRERDERNRFYRELARCLFSPEQIAEASADDLQAALKSQLLKSRLLERERELREEWEDRFASVDASLGDCCRRLDDERERRERAEERAEENRLFHAAAVNDLDAERLRRGVAEAARERAEADLDEAIDLLRDRRLKLASLGETATEFDAWLSMRGEFREVLTAFRRAFGTDWKEAALPQPEGSEDE